MTMTRYSLLFLLSAIYLFPMATLVLIQPMMSRWMFFSLGMALSMAGLLILFYLMKERDDRASGALAAVDLTSKTADDAKASSFDDDYACKTFLQISEASSTFLSKESSLEDQSDEASSIKELSSLSHQESSSMQSEAFFRLRHFLEDAEKITPSQHFKQQTSPFCHSAADNYALDLRRLLEGLREEQEFIIWLYSPKDCKLLFASPQVRNVSGFSPDQFAQNFINILISKPAWQQAISNLEKDDNREMPMQLSIKARSLEEIFLQGCLGKISTGIFAGHLIAVLTRQNQV